MCKDSETGRAERKLVWLKNGKPGDGCQEKTLGTAVTTDLL